MECLINGIIIREIKVWRARSLSPMSELHQISRVFRSSWIRLIVSCLCMNNFTTVRQKGLKQNHPRTNTDSKNTGLFFARVQAVVRLESMICCSEFFGISEAARWQLGQTEWYTENYPCTMKFLDKLIIDDIEIYILKNIRDDVELRKSTSWVSTTNS